MPKTFDRPPELPRMRRRIGRDTTELLVTSLALLSTTIVFGILIRWSVFDIEADSEYQFIKYFFIGSTLLLWLLEIRLELTAKKKAEDLYQIQMNEYEIMRTKWLEIASQKMELDAKRSMEPMKTVSAAQVVVQPAEPKTSVQEKNPESD
jgi:hypothetical protein